MDEKIKKLNDDLKSIRCPVRVRRKGDKLYLRATLPPKPDSLKDRPFQQEIALGVNASAAGLKTARAEALRIGAALDMGTFHWGEYYQPKAKIETVGQWVEEFERDYFGRRKRDRKSQTTWYTDYWAPFKVLPQDEPLTKLLLVEAIATESDPDSRTRQRMCKAFAALATFAGIDLDVSRLIGNYSPKRVQARDLPSDQLIMEVREAIAPDGWRWVFGMMAAYGLRNHEIFYIDLEAIAQSEIAIVLDGKTGPRKVLPIPTNWWSDWELNKPVLPRPLLNSQDCANNRLLGHKISDAFRRLKIPFSPYDLRHAWTARAAIAGVDDAIAARMQGHSLAVHAAIYMNFLNDGHYAQMLEKLRKNEES